MTEPIANNDHLYKSEVTIERFTSTPGTQEQIRPPSIAALPDGQYVVAWSSTFDVFMRIMNAEGTPVTHAVQVWDAPGFSSAQNVEVTALSDGQYVLTWTSNTQNGALAEVFDADGTSVSGQFGVANAPGAGGRPEMIPLPDGNLLFVWPTDYSSNVTSRMDAQIFDRNGAPVGEMMRLNTGGQNFRSIDDIQVLDAERFIVSWSTPNTFNNDAMARIYDLEGQPLSARFDLAENTQDAQTDSQIIPLEGGRFLAVFLTDGDTGFESDQIAVRLFDKDGTPLSGEAIVTQTAGPGFSNITLNAVALPDGRVLIVWQTLDEQDDVVGYGSKGRLIAQDGTPIGDEFLLNEDIIGNEGYPDVTVLDTGEVVVTYVSAPYRRTNDANVYDLDTRVLVLEDGPVRLPEPDGGSRARTTENALVLIQPWELLGNDTDADGDPLSIVSVSATSAEGAAVSWSPGGPIFYDPSVSTTLRALNTGEQLRDSFTYTVSDGTETDTATVTLDVAGRNNELEPDFARDDVYALTAEQFATASTSAVQIAADLDRPQANDDTFNGILLVNGLPLDLDMWFNGSQGGQFRIDRDGNVDFRNISGSAEVGVTTGFRYTTFEEGVYDSATVSLRIAGDPFELVDDEFAVTDRFLDDVGSDWFRLGAKKAGTDLLTNDFRVDAIASVNGAPLTEGVWFDGDGGGQFRVFSGGVVDFRDQGGVARVGTTTSFTYAPEGSGTDARVTLTVNPPGVVDDVYSISQNELAAANQFWFRLGARADNTDLLQNDTFVFEIEDVNGQPIEEGVWFDGDGGGQFRVFSGGVVDFRNQGETVQPGDVTGFSYSANGDDLRETAHVTLVLDDFSFL